MFRKFISWKKNIEPIYWNGLHVYIDSPSVKYEELWSEICKLIHLHQEISIKKDLIQGKYQTEENKYSRINSIEGNKQNSINEYISFAYLKKTKFNNNKKIILQIHAETLSRILIENLISIKGSYFAILFNPYYKYWESKRIKNSFYYQGGLKEKFDFVQNKKVLDRSNMPGRYTSVSDFSFLGGSEYWISQKLLSREELESISDIEINELESNNLIHAKLFDLSQYWEDSSQNKIAKLRKLLQIDEKSKS